MTCDVLAFDRWFALLAATLVLAGCGGDGTGPAASPVGEYQLRARDGTPVPVMLSTGDSLLSGTFAVRGDSTFVLNPTYRRGSGTPWTTTIAGRWTGTPTALRYYDPNGNQIATGASTRGGITFVQHATFEFVRR